MSDFSLISVLQFKTSKIFNDMANVSIKSERITPFGGIFHVMKLLIRHIGPVIDEVPGLSCTTFGYQYSEIVRSLMRVYFCGGDCVEDVSSHHMPQHELDRIKADGNGMGCTYCCFKSPSGDGLKVIIHTDNYDIDKYSNCYRQVEQIFIDYFGIKPDKKCEDLSRACYISYDPELYHNERTFPWHFEYKPEFDKRVNSPHLRS